jgi:enoyl-CoA hydratase
METISIRHEGAVAVVRLDRPPVNAVTRQMMGELQDCFRILGDDRTINAVVLSAEGTRAFCAGIDLKEPSAGRSREGQVADVLDSGRYWRETQHLIRHCPVPVIAAVDGPAIGAGFGLVGICDLIVASRRATFVLNEINVGLLGGASKALRLVGPFKARMMLFSGQVLDADDLYRFGSVERVVDAGDAEASAIDLASVFEKLSPIALRLAKESILRIEGLPLEDAYRTEQDYTNRLRGYADSAEAMSAFREKRDPEWTWS